MAVILSNARDNRADRIWLERVLPLYLHDLSEYDPHLFTLSDDGRWLPEQLGAWLGEPGGLPLVIRDGATRIGFALVAATGFPWLGEGHDYRMGEFFILRAHRRSGIGRLAALDLFRRYRGRWELCQLPANQGAIRFWAQVIGELGVPVTHRIDNGAPCQSFDTRGAV
ncbi:GNAT family N-acetyltransferase [Zavarzinia sp. CC-PAN008]|uniref:GNAT family N-acetyltransferase n=1 Tax=Zavarzinia sp. CC-PAN008 TaxID=3243332 RepID=UPI003F743042